MKRKYISALVFSVLVLAACSPAVSDNTLPEPVEPATAESVVSDPQTEQPAESMTAAEVSFSKDIWPVLEQFALSAHGGKGGVFLESYADVMKYVVPGDPEESMLYKRLTGDGVDVMPPSGPLPAETIQLFYDWIKQGAQDN